MAQHNERTFDPAGIHRLEDPERLSWLPPEETLQALGVQPGWAVADIGAGTGYFALPLARACGPHGRVFAVDFQKEMLDYLKVKLAVAEAPANVTACLGSAEATGLDDNSCDLVFLANVWHELDSVSDVLAEMRRILRPVGRVAVLDWRTDVERPPGPPLEHRVAVQTLERDLQDTGWVDILRCAIGDFSYLVLARPG